MANESYFATLTMSVLSIQLTLRLLSLRPLSKSTTDDHATLTNSNAMEGSFSIKPNSSKSTRPSVAQVTRSPGIQMLMLRLSRTRVRIIMKMSRGLRIEY